MRSSERLAVYMWFCANDGCLPIIDGHYIDLRREQFDLYGIPISYEQNDLIDRKYCGNNPNTQERYRLFVKHIYEYLNGES